LPTDVSQLGEWYGVPAGHVRQRFEAHLKSSPFPEDFSGVAHSAKPPKDRGFTILYKDVTVLPAMRQRLSIDPDSPTDCFLSCNLCGPAPQFKNCGYAILCDNGHIYFVGSICAAKHYEGRFEDARRIFHREQDERRAQEYFFEHASRIPGVAADAKLLFEIAERYAPAHKQLKRLPTFRKALRHAIVENGGWLQIETMEQVKLADGSAFPRASWENFERITGETAVRSEYHLHDQLRDNIKLLNGFGSSETEVLEGVLATQESGKLPELLSAVLRATQIVDAARDDLRKFRAFFQQDNLESIQRWLRHRESKLQCRAENSGRVWWFRAFSSDEPRRFDMSVFDAPIPKAPE